MKNILITGGAGFIGSELTLKLLASQHKVVVFDNFSVGSKKNIWKNITVIKGDLRSPKDLKKLSPFSFHAVYHLAALHFIPYCNENPEETIDVNIHGTHNLLNVLARKPPQKLFFASTAAVYAPSHEAHQESELPGPMDIYGLTKLSGEHLVRLFAKTSPTQCVIGRLFNAYGPRETNPHLIPAILAQIKKKVRSIKIGNRKPYRDYMHTHDMTLAMIQLMSCPLAESVNIVNIGSGKEYSVDEVLVTLQKALHRPFKTQTQAKLVRKVERMHLRPSVAKLNKLIGFRSMTTLEQGLQDLIRDVS